MKPSLSHSRGIVFALTGFTLWVLNDTCIKLVADAAIPPPEVAAVLGLTGVAFMVTKALLQGTTRHLRPGNLRTQMASALVSTSAIFTCVVGLKHLPFIVFYITVFTAPLVVALLASVVLKEKLTRGKMIAIVGGFLGVIIATNPLGAAADNMHGDWIGYAAMAVNVLSFASLMILQRRIMQSETEESVAFMQILVQAAVFGTVTLFSYVPLSPLLLLILGCGGVLGILGNLCNILATKNTTAATVAQFHYTQIISGALIGFLIWHEMPTLPLIAGSAIIIASGIYIANHMRKIDTESAVKVS